MSAQRLAYALRKIVESLSEHDDEGMLEHAEQIIEARAALADHASGSLQETGRSARAAMRNALLAQDTARETCNARAAEDNAPLIPIRAHDSDAAGGQGVPDGWQLVPKVPTEAMVEADLALDIWATPADSWAAMLSAAPSPQEAK